MLMASPAVWHYRTYVITLLLKKLVPPSSYCAFATNSWESNLRFAKLRTMSKHRSLLRYTKATQASQHRITMFAFSALKATGGCKQEQVAESKAPAHLHCQLCDCCLCFNACGFRCKSAVCAWVLRCGDAVLAGLVCSHELTAVSRKRQSVHQAACEAGSQTGRTSANPSNRSSAPRPSFATAERLPPSGASTHA